MFGVCPACGADAVEKAIDPSGPIAVCPESPRRLPACVVLESDVLRRAEFDGPEDGYQDVRNTWPREVTYINQSGRPVVRGGSAVPEQSGACT